MNSPKMVPADRNECGDLGPCSAVLYLRRWGRCRSRRCDLRVEACAGELLRAQTCFARGLGEQWRDSNRENCGKGHDVSPALSSIGPLSLWFVRSRGGEEV